MNWNKNLTATYTSVFCRHESLQKFKFYFLVFFKIQWTFILFFARREFNPLSTQEYKKPVQYTILGEIPTFLCRHCSRLVSPDLQLKYIWRWRTCHISSSPVPHGQLFKVFSHLFLFFFSLQYPTYYTVHFRQDEQSQRQFVNVAFPHG